jgi:Domain of unknown function (DUF4823)
MRLLLPLLAACSLAGCADSHQLTRTTGPESKVTLERQASAYVAVPADGRFEAKTYQGSGAMTAQIVATAFASFLARVVTGFRVEDSDQAMLSAKKGGFTYLIYPQILHWEDRATEWSSKPDVVAVKLSIISSATGAVIDSAMIEGMSGIATFGGDKPQHLLPKPTGEYATSLFK